MFEHVVGDGGCVFLRNVYTFLFRNRVPDSRSSNTNTPHSINALAQRVRFIYTIAHIIIISTHKRMPPPHEVYMHASTRFEARVQTTCEL